MGIFIIVARRALSNTDSNKIKLMATDKYKNHVFLGISEMRGKEASGEVRVRLSDPRKPHVIVIICYKKIDDKWIETRKIDAIN